MSTFVKHLFAPLVRGGGLIQDDAILIAIKDHGIDEDRELISEIEIVQENGELLLRATTNRQLELDLDGEPQIQLYDSTDPYCYDEKDEGLRPVDDGTPEADTAINHWVRNGPW